NVVMKEFLSCIDSYDCLQLGRVAHRHLQSIEAAPGNSVHPDLAVRPRLRCQAVNYLLAVNLFLFGVLPVRRTALARTETTNVDACAHVSAAREISIGWIVARGGAVVFAVGEVVEQGR